MFGYGLLSSAKTSQQKEIRREKYRERRDRDSQIDRLRHRDRQTRRDSQTGTQREGAEGVCEGYRQTEKQNRVGERWSECGERRQDCVCTSLLNVQMPQVLS